MQKKEGKLRPNKGPYEAIEMPKNTGLGAYIGGFSFLFGFALVWYVWWLAAASFLGILICVILRGSNDHFEEEIHPEQIEKIELAWEKRHG